VNELGGVRLSMGFGDEALPSARMGSKLAGVSLPESLLGDRRVQRIAGLLPIAMLSALIVTDLFDSNRHYTANWHTLAGVGAGVIVLWRGRSLVVVFLAAIIVTAVLRAVA
jgi:branched-subunit amino acid transport protein